ncbi:MAG: hypothetical protein R3F34_15270 [Planctomycetota bacterium]
MTTQRTSRLLALGLLAILGLVLWIAAPDHWTGAASLRSTTTGPGSSAAQVASPA